MAKDKLLNSCLQSRLISVPVLCRCISPRFRGWNRSIAHTLQRRAVGHKPVLFDVRACTKSTCQLRKVSHEWLKVDPSPCSHIDLEDTLKGVQGRESRNGYHALGKLAETGLQSKILAGESFMNISHIFSYLEKH